MADTSQQSTSGMSTRDEWDSDEDDDHDITIRHINVYIRLREVHRLLLLGCYSGDVQTVRVLLLHVCKKASNRCNYMGTPLRAACKGRYVSVLEELVKAGADVNLQGNDGVIHH
jgi:hypothetical protein